MLGPTSSKMERIASSVAPLYRQVVSISTTFINQLKTTSLAGDAVKTVKPHVQSIKFPSRRAQDLKPPAAQHFGVSNTVESLLTKPSQPASATGNKGPAIESSQLPLKYRRKPLSPEEMECIEKGGQV